MKILIDMNLSPAWVEEFATHGIKAVHWTSIGDFDAPDKVLMKYAKDNGYIVFTHDLDFGTALALTHAEKPSVIQVRTQDVTILHMKNMIINTLLEYAVLLEKGALIIIDEQKRRVRILPL